MSLARRRENFVGQGLEDHGCYFQALHLAARYCRDLEALQLVDAWHRLAFDLRHRASPSLRSLTCHPRLGEVQHWPSHAKHRDKFGRLPLHRAAESGRRHKRLQLRAQMLKCPFMLQAVQRPWRLCFLSMRVELWSRSSEHEAMELLPD